MSKDFDYAKMVDAEDAAARGMLPGDPGYSEMFPHVKVVHSSASYDELRQQLADVSNERDGLRADARRYEYLKSISAAPEDYAELDAKIDAELSEVKS